ncbi:hypothetical protein, partial [Enterovibrio baiacu]|uniref:hypothetical protein n=1 Tax=Enterovibrio baiacu TaxID=2491023 RepID=UPI00196A8F58
CRSVRFSSSGLRILRCRAMKSRRNFEIFQRGVHHIQNVLLTPFNRDKHWAFPLKQAGILLIEKVTSSVYFQSILKPFHHPDPVASSVWSGSPCQ